MSDDVVAKSGTSWLSRITCAQATDAPRLIGVLDGEGVGGELIQSAVNRENDQRMQHWRAQNR